MGTEFRGIAEVQSGIQAALSLAMTLAPPNQNGISSSDSGILFERLAGATTLTRSDELLSESAARRRGAALRASIPHANSVCCVAGCAGCYESCRSALSPRWRCT